MWYRQISKYVSQFSSVHGITCAICGKLKLVISTNFLFFYKIGFNDMNSMLSPYTQAQCSNTKPNSVQFCYATRVISHIEAFSHGKYISFFLKALQRLGHIFTYFLFFLIMIPTLAYVFHHYLAKKRDPRRITRDQTWLDTSHGRRTIDFSLENEDRKEGCLDRCVHYVWRRFMLSDDPSPSEGNRYYCWQYYY